MGARRTVGIGRVRAPIAVLAAALAAVVFVVVAARRLDPATPAGLALIAGALVVGALLAGAAVRTGSLRIVGTLVAVVAVWLLFQRADAGTIAVLAAFFGAGLALGVGPMQPSEPS